MPMKAHSACAVFLFVILTGLKPWAQGPPYQTDDPVPVDLHHYEFYIFGSADGTPVEMDSSGPAFEFNWGALPRVQLHAVLPFGVVAPLNNPIYLPSGTGPTAFGLTDMELGAKIAFIKESKRFPQIGAVRTGAARARSGLMASSRALRSGNRCGCIPGMRQSWNWSS